MKTSDFYYDLPQELIAQTPLAKRDTSRMLVYNKDSGEICHKHFFDIVDYLTENDVLVMNRSRVIPARLYGHRVGKSEEVVEILMLKKLELNTYECLVKPGKKFKQGNVIEFSDNLTGEVKEILPTGERVICFNVKDNSPLEVELDKIGEMPNSIRKRRG